VAHTAGAGDRRDEEELPEERESRLAPFVGAAAVYAFLLLLG
jgi:hypothetical protein